MVRVEGIEPTLHKLRQEGVYFSCEEYKGKKDVVRGGKVFRFRESDFDNPFLSSHLEAHTSASRSSGTRVTVDLGRYHYYAAYTRVMYAAHGIWGSPILIWLPALPAGAGETKLLWLAKMGSPPVRWFSHIEPRTVMPSSIKRLVTYYIVYAGRLFGTNFPRPEYISVDKAYQVASCMAELLKQGHGCVLETYANSAVRVCQIAKEKGLDISGTTFVVGGEPLTEAKYNEIREAGANVVVMYGMVDMGLIGFSCANPTAVDDVHLFKNAHAVIQHEREVPHSFININAFLFTSWLYKSAKILLNVESGDYGVIETRNCGCEFGKLGLTEHIYNIRGFDKLTGEGVTFIGSDLIRIMEEILPTRFGGSSTDYQMVEEEDEKRHTRLTVLVSPEVGKLDESELVQTILTELGKDKDWQRMATKIWSEANTLRVERRRPFTTAHGKLLPLHIHKGKIESHNHQ
jgi:hypothetical protein